MGGYIDLAQPNPRLNEACIKRDEFGCKLIGSNGTAQKGFLLARSRGGNALTYCDIDFHPSTIDGKYQPRLTFRRTDQYQNDKPVKPGRFQRISFQKSEDGYREFWQMVAFLYRFKELVDLGEFADTFRATTDDDIVIHLNSYDASARSYALADIVDRANIDVNELSQLLLVRSRQAAVAEFRALLDDRDSYRYTYRKQHSGSIKGAGEEALWHHFLSVNRWIFGLSLDLRFIEDFVDEASVGITDTTHRGNPRSDMLAWSDYTVLVELKTPDTDIFTVTKNSGSRAGTWSFSSAFIEGVSQCLAQRSSWERHNSDKQIVLKDADGNLHELDKGTFRTIDPRVIFIIGHKEREIPRSSPHIDVRVKRDTLERFARNNNNISIVTYDELYRRAFHVAHGENPPAIA